MNALTGHLHDAYRTLVPEPENPHGPLPVLLVGLTVVTGLVDAYSYLDLGHVFVANMTGNVVFLAFALGGASGFVWWSSVLAILIFVLGAGVGGRIRRAYGSHRGRHVLVAALVQLVAVTAAFIVALVAPAHHGHVDTAALIVLLGIGMGLQNATARALAVPDLTTTVLTLTLTGISADSRPGGGNGSKAGRRLVSVLSMFAGALVGTVLVEVHHAPLALLLAALILVVTVLATVRVRSSQDAWTAIPGK